MPKRRRAKRKPDASWAATEATRALAARVRARLVAQGYRSTNHACLSLAIDPLLLQRVIHQGLSDNPRVRTVEALDRLGIRDLVVPAARPIHERAPPDTAIA